MSVLVGHKSVRTPRAAFYTLTGHSGATRQVSSRARSSVAHLGYETTAAPSSADTDDKHFLQCAPVTHVGVAAILS
ncbi:hypothetical protein OPT61_g278 [Boeremia exigua]|uniref:Uncharacterized protein n=1 Tax=Boeremia exigua TaxID=749465 RepID=A0ACC2IUE5_9PLEO|nr:hypothetical protein OPT61_g278 [Boeremia exigua]